MSEEIVINAEAEKQRQMKIAYEVGLSYRGKFMAGEAVRAAFAIEAALKACLVQDTVEAQREFAIRAIRSVARPYGDFAQSFHASWVNGVIDEIVERIVCV